MTIFRKLLGFLLGRAVDPVDGVDGMDPVDQLDCPAGFVSLPKGCRITRYGFATDSTPDRLTRAGIGAWNNRLGPLSMAVSRDVEALFLGNGIRPRDYVVLLLGNGRVIPRSFDDRTARRYRGKVLTGRLDLYCPNDEYQALDGIRVVGFRRAGL